MGVAVSSVENVIVLSGLDGAGKSALLRTARDGQTLPIVERSGVIYEIVTLGDRGTNVHVCDVTAAKGAGAFRFLRALEAVSGSGDSHALVHVIRASDRRAHSSLWELYSIVRSFRCAYMPVCVVVVRDDPLTSPALARLATREALPPGSSSHWPPDFRFEGCVVGSGGVVGCAQIRLDAELRKSPIRCVHETGMRSRCAAAEPWLSEGHLGEDDEHASHIDGALLAELGGAASEADGDGIFRQWEADYRYLAEHRETQSHGFGVALDANDSPLLSALHCGPWLVLELDSLADVPAALEPFRWAQRECKPQGARAQAARERERGKAGEGGRERKRELR